ncbi:MAG: alpha/beta hydrolase [Acidobacteriota bacterium]
MNAQRDLAIALFLLLGSTVCLTGKASAQEAVPRFEASDCVFPAPMGDNVVCGYVVVPENRAKPKGKTIRLPIIIQKSSSSTPKPDPVLRTLGGPGASSLKLVRGRRSSPWLRDRDVIIFEQRGTKYAQPALECPEVDDSNIASAKKHLDRRAARTNEVSSAKKCYDRLSAAGIDLSSYNSAENAADIEDVRRVLKLDKLNLYGVSYSSRLMLDVMRYFPKGIRSVVIESTLSPEVNYDEVGVDGVVRSLNELFASCRADADCAAAYPDLEKEFYAVVAKLNRGPVSVSTKDPASAAMFDITLNGDDFATWVVDYLFSNEPSATVEAPYVVHKAFTGDYVDQFKRYAGDKLSGSFYSWGMRYSVWCSEEMPFENTRTIRNQSAKYSGLAGYEVMALPDICSVWKVKPAKPVANQPVTSDIPTLVIGAQYDSYTDPQWGRNVAKRLKNGFFVEIPWAGHGPGFSVPCVGNMVADFFNDPASAPNPDCVEKTKSKFTFSVKKQ